MISNTRLNFVRQVFCTYAACCFFGTIAVAQDPDPRELLSRMSDEIAGLEQFAISGDAYSDAQLDAGLIIEHAAQATMQVNRPDSVRITNRTEEEFKELYFTSNQLTIYTQSKNFFGQIEFPEGTTDGFTYAVDQLGIDAPMIDFVSGEVAKRMLATATEVLYVGTSLIRDSEYDHVVIRTAEIDVQLWIATEGPPLPGKMSLSAKWDGGAPRTVVFMNWDTSPDFSADVFDFERPDGAQEIAIASQFNF